MEFQPITASVHVQLRGEEPGSVYTGEAQRMKTVHMLQSHTPDSPSTGSNHVIVDNLTTADMTIQPTAHTRKLIVCFLGIFVSYFVYGLLQEKITRGQYGEGDSQEKFTYTLTLVFVQCVINVIFAQIAIKTTSPDRDYSPQRYYMVMAFSYLGAMIASNQSLQFVSYPTQVLGKSAKPIPVMILGVLMARKRYPIQKYFFVFMIVIGVALFMYKDNKGTEAVHTLGSGEVLLMISLFLDGVTGGVQDKLRSEHKTQAHYMMLHMNVWSVLYLGVALVATGEAIAFLGFASRYPIVIFNLFIFSLCSAVGQNFIFMTVTAFGPLTCSIFTTTRKFFTILASVIIFQNPMSYQQWLGTLFVFIGLSLDGLYGKERKAIKTKS